MPPQCCLCRNQQACPDRDMRSEADRTIVAITGVPEYRCWLETQRPHHGPLPAQCDASWNVALTQSRASPCISFCPVGDLQDPKCKQREIRGGHASQHTFLASYPAWASGIHEFLQDEDRVLGGNGEPFCEPAALQR